MHDSRAVNIFPSGEVRSSDARFIRSFCQLSQCLLRDRKWTNWIIFFKLKNWIFLSFRYYFSFFSFSLRNTLIIARSSNPLLRINYGSYGNCIIVWYVFELSSIILRCFRFHSSLTYVSTRLMYVHRETITINTFNIFSIIK